MYKRASNPGAIFFLALVKYVSNFTLFSRESELCCDFALLGVVLMAFNLVNFYFTLKRGTNTINYTIFSSIDVWQSCLLILGKYILCCCVANLLLSKYMHIFM